MVCCQSRPAPPFARKTPSGATPGNRDVPPFSLGGPDDYDISPDGQEVCYSMNADPVPAASTNTDLYVVPIAGGQSRKITATPAADASPRYSPDGKYLAWRAQFRAGYESDRWRLMVLERATGKVSNLSENLDRWVTNFTWAPDSTGLFFTTVDRGRQAIELIPVTGGAARLLRAQLPGTVVDVAECELAETVGHRLQCELVDPLSRRLCGSLTREHRDARAADGCVRAPMADATADTAADRDAAVAGAAADCAAVQNA